MDCIICNKPVIKNSLEHIVPEGLGNKSYTLDLGAICGVCNNSFSNFEAKALSNGILAMSRPMAGIQTKKGKPAKGTSHGLSFEGNKNYTANQVTVFGLTEDNVLEIKEDGSYVVNVPDFEKNEVPVSKLLLKISIEALYQSQRALYRKTDLQEVRTYLDKKSNVDWPFVTTKLRPSDFKSVPRFQDKLYLKKINCEILYKIINPQIFLINFRYKFLSYLINIASRDMSWIGPYQELDNTLGIQLLKKKHTGA
ncbi:HNH endonuclease [Mucilaginibacter dorajii]|uniref:HNH endonuclease 5 domain-containing protein n=1 Tax=Mucilaginibacter dorajii TaxID=692994 RepID=A0ABP7Q7Y5_9SPHI|nr:HNH endonuclease [Mucilaginibacter dorajii]MCS3732565.1 hypothetical protein [Mucilaginibacter dorajii]